jgi:tRNA U34 5-carboxymethylaminomethyl modifying GTPase MnmE/TrmE
VRLQPVADAVKAKEAALGVCDISGMTKSQAVKALWHKLKKGEFTPREAAAISLVDRIIVDPHSVDDALFAELRRHFSEEEIIELVCASSLFTWAGTLNTVVRLDTDPDGKYNRNLAYATATAAAAVAA